MVEQKVKIPTSVEEAQAMILIAMSWLKTNSPLDFKELEVECGVDVMHEAFVAGALKARRLYSCELGYNPQELAEAASEYVTKQQELTSKRVPTCSER